MAEMLKIKIMPDWAHALGSLIMLLEAGDAKGRELARSELRRMAAIADTAVAQSKAHQYTLSEEERQDIADGKTVFLFNDDGECFTVLKGYKDMDGVTESEIEAARHRNDARREGGE